MKKIKIISDKNSHTAINIGRIDKISEHSLIQSTTQEKIKGKIFLKGILKATGTEISFSTLPPNSELPFFHTHIENEETYIILKGEGDFQVDDDCFAISEGSIIRVAHSGKRGLRNTSDDIMTYVVIQSKEGSLKQYSGEDGELIDCERKWK